jgi:para-nitrobenzyl esterase
MRSLAAAALACAAIAGPALAEAPQARVSGGLLAGVREGGADAFLGIPFAAPPTGANRWRAPQPAQPWSGVRDAGHFGASCWQGVAGAGFGPWTHEYVVQDKVSEDCLFLNVWTAAAGGARRPVLVWFHGGGFSQGSGSVPIYDGAALAGRGVVVVTVNYRLGVLGFLAHPDLTREAAGAAPGNWGLQDMVAALKWIRANIAAFGGDPDQVTIAGQSAGAIAVHDLVASPLAKGLFHRAIAESGLPSLAPTPLLAKAEEAGLAFARSKGAASIAELRAMTPGQLTGGPPQPLAFFPIADGVLLPEAPAKLYAEGRINDVPMLAGLNGDEGSAMSPAWGVSGEAAFKALLERSYGAMAGRFAGLYPAASDAERAAASKAILRERGLAALWVWARDRVGKAKAPVYGYLYQHPEPGPQAARYGAFHSSEIPYVFQTLDKSPERGFTAADRALSLQVSTYWLDFVRAGDPNGKGLPAWPQLKLDDPQIMALGETAHAQPILEPAKLQATRDFVAGGGQPSLF